LTVFDDQEGDIVVLDLPVRVKGQRSDGRVEILELG
jgi:hypothetical protein